MTAPLGSDGTAGAAIAAAGGRPCARVCRGTAAWCRRRRHGFRPVAALRVVLAVLLVAFTALPAVADPLERIAVQLHWLHQFEFAGFYMAKHRGYYQAAGLDVEFLPFQPENTDVVGAVTSGKARYGVGYSSVLYDYFSGRPVVALAALLQDSPLVLMTRDEPDLRRPRDLRGKRVMIGGDALNSASIMALLFADGLTRNDFVRQEHSFDIADLIAGRTDAMTAYLSNEPFHMQERGVGYRLFDPGEAGFSFYGDILFTSRDEVENHPERTRALVEATLKGWEYAFAHVDETIQVIIRDYNVQGKSYASLQFEAKALKPLALAPDIRVGGFDLVKLEKIADAYRLMGLATTTRRLADFIWEGARTWEKRRPVFTDAETRFIKNTEVRTATTTNWAPFSFVDRGTGAATGISHEFWGKIVEMAGLRQTITAFDSFVEEVEHLRDRRQDVIYSAGLTEERQQYALFSEPYASFPLVFATSKEENFISSPAALEGRTVAVGRNFTAHRMMAAAYPNIRYLPVDDVVSGLQAVSRGDAYAFVDVMPVVAHSINTFGYTNLKISGDTGLVYDLRVMVRKDYPELVSIANKVIAVIEPSESRKIIDRWINVEYQRAPSFSEYMPYIILIGIGSAIAFLWLYVAKRQADRANRAKSEFLALMSHDLRTPLNAVIGFTDMMRGQVFGPLGHPRYVEYAEDIHNSGTLLVSLINDILDLSKVESGKYDLNEEILDLHELTAAAVSQCAVLGYRSSVRVSNRTVERFPKLRGDRRVLIQILNNVISNAVKFSRDAGVVEVSTHLDDRGAVLISVKDNGDGMSPAELKKALRPFEQADRNDVRRAQGTGLGLYLCHRFMRLLSGQLRIESEVGAGTRVTLAFPPERTVQA